MDYQGLGQDGGSHRAGEEGRGAGPAARVCPGAWAGRGKLGWRTRLGTTHVLAMVPRAMGTAEGAPEMMADMSITMISGKGISTLITLVFTPVYYSVIDDLTQKLTRRKKKILPA